MPRRPGKIQIMNSSDFVHENQHEKACLVKTKLSDEKEFCEYHDGKAIEMYCQHHDAVCCSVCISEDHRHCSRIDSIPKIAKRFLYKDISVKHDLLEVSRELRELKRKQMSFREDMDKNEAHIVLEIQQYKAHLLKRVENLERASLSEVKKQFSHRKLTLDQDIERVDKMLLDVERDLCKITEETPYNEDNLFVNLKLAKRHMSTRIDCRTELFGKPYEKIDFNIHTEMKLYFKNFDSLITLTKTRRPLTPFVNIMVPVPTSATDCLKHTLQADLKHTGIRSKFINILNFVPDVYTIVLVTCMDDIRHLHIGRQHHHNIIILRLDDTPAGGRSFMDKISDYMIVPSGKDIFNFLNWANVALKTSISFTHVPSAFQYQFNRSDKMNALRQIAETIETL